MVERLLSSKARRENLRKTKINPRKNLPTPTVSDQRIIRNAKHPPKCCYHCDNSPPHKREECPANEATCLKCKKIGYYASQCRTKNVRSIEEEEDSEISSSDDYFLGSIESDEKQRKWSVELMLGYTPVNF